MVFAFAGDSTITSVLAMARDTLAMHWDTPRMAPRPSPVYILVAALSWPVLYGLFRLRSRGREHLPDGGYVLAANHISNLDPWPLGLPLFPQRYLRFMAKSELFWSPFKQFAIAAGAFPVRRGEGDTAAIDTAARALPRGPHRRHVPRGHAAQEGAAEEVRGAGAHGRGADRARGGRRRSSRPGSPAPTGSAGSRSSASRTARRSRSTTSPAARTRRRSRPSG